MRAKNPKGPCYHWGCSELPTGTKKTCETHLKVIREQMAAMRSAKKELGAIQLQPKFCKHEDCIEVMNKWQRYCDNHHPSRKILR